MDRIHMPTGMITISLLPSPPPAICGPKGCACGPTDDCRCPHPIPPESAASANDACGLCGYWRCRCGEALAVVFAAEVHAAIEAIAAGVLPYCGGLKHCGRDMIHEGDGRYVCARLGCGYTIDTGHVVDALPALPRPEAADIGGGFCQGCGQPVSTLNGRYTCNSCGHNG